MAEHLAAYARMDIALDTFPYHGTTTTCEALWMGVPVVSLEGDRHSSRVGVSLLRAVDHGEWIARDGKDYVRIAATLAGEAPLRAELRSKLRGQMRRSASARSRGPGGALRRGAGGNVPDADGPTATWRNPAPVSNP